MNTQLFNILTIFDKIATKKKQTADIICPLCMAPPLQTSLRSVPSSSTIVKLEDNISICALQFYHREA